MTPMDRPAIVRATAAGVLGVGLLAGCGGSATTPGSTPATSVAPSAAEITVGAVQFRDAFDSNANRWIEQDVMDNSDFRLAFESGSFHWTLRNPRPLILVPDSQIDQRRADVVVRATVAYTGEGFVGVTCRSVQDTDSEAQFYEFMVRDGLGVIRKNDLGDHVEELAKVEKLTLDRTRDHVVEGRCLTLPDGAARLALHLDGAKVIETTVKNPLGAGEAGIKAQGRPDAGATEYRWREFSISEAKG